MAQLAIQGHKTRGSEVIALLKMLGGINECFKLDGLNEQFIYYICPEYNNDIHSAVIPTDQIVFSLEQFEEKYPYKVGDKVWLHYENSTIRVTETITCMRWCDKCNCVLYDVFTYCNLREYAFTPYKEETMEERQYKELRMALDDDDKLATEATIDGNKILPPNGYLIGKITQVDNGMLVEYVKQLPQYPKTYEECCYVTKFENIEMVFEDDYIDINPPKEQEERLGLINQLNKLLICRDAYWKIAGDWKPDWNNISDKHCIYVVSGDVWLKECQTRRCNLAFPTKEMRDAFYENFKELIESCKELL